jgi:hypothetical protein
MIKITFEGTTDEVLKEIQTFNATITDDKKPQSVTKTKKEETPKSEPKVETIAPVAPVTPTKETVAPAAPTAPVKTYTLPEIQKTLQPLMDEGRTAELVGLLQKFGVADLTKLPTDQYPDFINDLRALGVRL